MSSVEAARGGRQEVHGAVPAPLERHAAVVAVATIYGVKDGDYVPILRADAER